MAEEKKEDVAKSQEAPKETPAAAPAPAEAAVPAATPAPAEAAAAPASPAQEAKKDAAPVKTERPANCTGCNKSIKKKRWYYRDGKYYCTKRCWSTTVKKADKKEETPAAS